LITTTSPNVVEDLFVVAAWARGTAVGFFPLACEGGLVSPA